MIYLASLDEAMKDKVEGYRFIHTKSELDKIVVNNLVANRVIIRQDFAHKYFTPTGLVNYIENVRKINYNIVIDLDIKDEVVTKDVLLQKLRGISDIDELIHLAVTYENEFLDTIFNLIDAKNDDYNQMLEFSNQVSRLQSIIENAYKELEEKDYRIQQEADNKLSYQSKFHALVSRINLSHNKGIDKDRLFVCDSNKYDKILYIKEITRVQYMDTFLYYLKEILKTLYNMPTRFLVIENYYADGKIPLYPNLVPHKTIIERDVIKGDILMLGMQPKIMGDVLRNASGISILIVLDRGGYKVPHIKGSNVEVIYTVSDLKDKPKWVPNGRCISYSESTLFIPYIEGFEESDMASRISTYSSMKITKDIIKLLEKK